MRHSHLIIYIAALLALFMTSCSPHGDEDHRLESSVVLGLSWYDPADAGTPVSSFRVNIYDARGNVVFTRDDMTTREAASTPIALTPGTYSASITDGTFYSTVCFEVTGEGMIVVDAPLKRIKAQLTVIVEDAPSGTTLSGRVLNASSGWHFAIGSDGNIGLVLSPESKAVDLPSASAADGVITTEPAYVMPTVPTDGHSLIEVEVTEADGTRRASTLTCDPMLSGGKYTIKLNYSDISTPLTLSTVTINQWETLFIYEGEILNPVEIEASISGKATRICYDGNTATFTEGDEIAVITAEGKTSIYKYTPTTPAPTYIWHSDAPLLWIEGTTASDFYGIYPADAETQSSGVIPDVLLAKAEKVSMGNKVSLNFSHAMAKLAVNLTLRNEIPADAALSVSVDAIAAYDIDLANMKVSPSGEASTVTLIEQKTREQYQTHLPQQDKVTTIKINDGTKTYTWTNSGGGISLEAGKVTTVSLKVGNDGITIGSVTVSDWLSKEIDNNGEQAEN